MSLMTKFLNFLYMSGIMRIKNRIFYTHPLTERSH